MSSFFLYIHKDRPLEQAGLNAIAGKLIHFPWVTGNCHVENNLQLVYTLNKTDRIRIFRRPEQNLTFFLHGNVFESSNGISRIEEENEKYSLENQIMNRYLKGGISSCVGLNGMYSLLVWNAKSGILEIAGDRLGIFQVFFALLGKDRFAITTDLAALKHIPDYFPVINKHGLFDLLYKGIAFENRTVLKDVQRLIPNASYAVVNNELKLVNSFRLPFSNKRWGYITPDILDELEHYYAQAIKRQLKVTDKIVFYQSGGKDSRIFSHFLKREQISPQCVTVGKAHHGEVFLAKMVSRALGFSWERVSCKPNFDPIYTDRFFAVDSFSGRIASTWKMKIAEKTSHANDYITAAYLGDPMFGSTIAKGQIGKSKTAHEVFNNYFERGRGGFFSQAELESLFPKQAEDWIRGYQKEAFELFTSTGDELYQMLLAYGLRSNDRFKVGGILRSINSAIPLRLPVIDNDLMDFLFSLPPALLYDRRLIDIFLSQRSKQLAAIPIDKNSSDYSALVRSRKSELEFMIWQLYTKKIKFPVFRLINPYSATTKCYVETFCLKDRGFEILRKEALSVVNSLDGLVNREKINEILHMPIPKGIDHVNSGNRLKSAITVCLAVNSLINNN